MRYAYYPGCSLEATGRPYEESVQAVAKALGIELVELEDWNCCGATAYMSINETLSFSLSARNLCQAKKIADVLITPCSACYTNLRKTETYLADFPEMKAKVGAALAEANLSYDGGVTTKHFLQTVVEDAGLDRIQSLVKHPLKGLRVAPYYGCQIARPYGIEGDTDDPVMMDHLLEAIGATPTHFPMKTVCCGGSLMGIRQEVALRLCRNILMCAQQYEAQCIAVTCPLCQMNLDAFQAAINKAYNTSFHFPILYFTQLMGLAFGLDSKDLGLKDCIVPAGEVTAKYA
ncbi:MAG: CoB--CoM heterodisulfide reductase iron-sulfur subunit B family protein [Acidobacteriota bacterium]|jgi:heterodisulfide reductase subunit B|nr:CoB--CoM heterodisulfide reductase iron-sulfur subunit B family protein [Acidobacteriota bacterium]